MVLSALPVESRLSTTPISGRHFPNFVRGLQTFTFTNTRRQCKSYATLFFNFHVTCPRILAKQKSNTRTAVAFAQTNSTMPQPAPQNANNAANATPHRQTLKFILVLLSGFLLGVLLGMLSTSLVFYFVPAPFLETVIKQRRSKFDELLQTRRMCKSSEGGFVEKFDPVENVVEICTCWPRGWSELGGWMVSCGRVELAGWGELGSWSLGRELGDGT